MKFFALDSDPKRGALTVAFSVNVETQDREFI